MAPILVKERAGYATITIVGDLDGGGLLDFAEALEHIAVASYVAVDLTETSAIDPAVVDIVITAGIRRRAAGGDLVLVCRPGEVARQLKQARVERDVHLLSIGGDPLDDIDTASSRAREVPGGD